MTILASLISLAGVPEMPIAAWEFNTPKEVEPWRANSHITNVTAENGILSCDTVDWDPFFTYSEAQIETSAWQFAVLRIKASREGKGQLFWTGDMEGKYNGFSEKKVTNFTIDQPDTWQEVVILPFWHTEGTIRQLRLDLYEDAHFELDWLRIYDSAKDRTPATDKYRWAFEDGGEAWRLWPGSGILVSPPLNLSVADKGWVSIALKAEESTTASLFWTGARGPGRETRTFEIDASDDFRVYDLELQGESAWRDSILALGLESAPAAGLTVKSIEIAERPQGPADIRVLHFGFENGANRAQRDCVVTAIFLNEGGRSSEPFEAGLEIPGGLTLVKGDARQTVGSLDFRQRATLNWTVRADAAGTAQIGLEFSENAPADEQRAVLEFLSPMPVQKAEYVPEPRPVETEIDVLAYYFPGWGSDVKWDPVRYVDPIRKPLLGYYDEGNPEVVDWQIKWAVENGITGFLVDWYWVAGSQHLTHWFEAYRMARYRDQLEVAIMWANHNPPDTHSAEDWRNVTQEWLDKYFNLPGYYRIDGKPAVFIWSPDNIRRDLGGPEAVLESFEESQQMARAAGYEGITYVAMGYNVSRDRSELLAKEGYYGFTTYHEWGDAVKRSTVPKRAQFSDVADTAPEAWDAHEAIAGPLTYFPVVDTGWDSRPWHGSRALAILGRTPDLFERILRDSKDWTEAHERNIVILGPLNEWGEGSYIEPNTEFGFKMYEAIRRVFAVEEPATWPVNIGPADVGLGPYAFADQAMRRVWDFSNGPQGWARMMGVSDFTVRDGMLEFTTTSADPALQVRTLGLQAAEFPRLTITMQVTGSLPGTIAGQLFWSETGAAISEATSVHFPIETEEAMHTYTLNLAKHPRWRGEITSLRFDPCNIANVTVTIDEIRFEK
ncbi:MAG: glycoside hydrolase family 99-like domain-containing protein [Candidatus Hydrogenedentota bacterium]